MSTEALTQTSEQAAPSDAGEDLTGRDRMVRNVLTSWAAYLVFVVAGFIMPRMIDRTLGQQSLGVWDFGWSLISYFGLVSAGVMTAVSRYVARYRALNDIRMLCTTVSTGLAMYLVSGTLVLGLTAVAVGLLPPLFGARLDDQVDEARWVVLLLGISLAVQIVFSVFNGVLTGCHRWSVHNAISASSYALVVVAMIVSLLAGSGLCGLAAMTLLGEVVAAVARFVAAHRVCPGMRLSWRMVRLGHAKELLWFGGKSLLTAVGGILLYKTNNLIALLYLGPAALALYSRPMSLVSHMGSIVSKFAHVLSPTASALQSAGDLESLRRIWVRAGMYSLSISLPMVLVAVLAGGDILELWMGAAYRNDLLIAVLAAGHLAAQYQGPTLLVLMGMGLHGFPAVATIVAAVCSIVMALVFVGPCGLGLLGLALAVTIPLTLVNTLAIPLYACRVLRTPYMEYLCRTVPRPLLACLPLAASLVAARCLFPLSHLAAPTLGLCCGGAVSVVVSWKYVLNESVRHTVLHLVRRSLAAR